MTYQEISNIKININEFLVEVQKISRQFGFKYLQFDNDFFSFIAKHVIFFKYLYVGQKNGYFYKVLISDLYYLVLSILKNERRYMYVNERSIIENYMRVIMCISLQDNHITEKIFKEMHRKNFECDFSDDEYSLIKNEYSTSCAYIHGGDILNDSLAYVFNECMCPEFKDMERRKYYIRFQNVLKIFDKLAISSDALYISGCFHRKKSIMQYLVGKEQVDLLFRILDSNK